MELRTLTAIALVMGLGAAPALAQEEAALDADENNEITEEEWGAYGDETFGEADADQGGYVDEEEYNTWATSNFGGEPGGGDDDGGGTHWQVSLKIRDPRVSGPHASSNEFSSIIRSIP